MKQQYVTRMGKTVEVEIDHVFLGSKMFEVSTPEGIEDMKKSPCYQEWLQSDTGITEEYDKQNEASFCLRMKNPPEEVVKDLLGMGEPPEMCLENPGSIDWDRYLSRLRNRLN